MDSLLPIWIFLLLTIGGPLLWLLFDHLQTQKATRTDRDGPVPLRPATPDVA